MSRNFRPPCTIELQPLSLTPLKMRKVQLEEVVGVGEADGVSGADGRVRIASNQMVLNSGRTSLLADPPAKLEMAGHRCRKHPPQRIGKPDWGILPASSTLLIPAVVRARVIT